MELTIVVKALEQAYFSAEVNTVIGSDSALTSAGRTRSPRSPQYSPSTRNRCACSRLLTDHVSEKTDNL